jgi:hypothetical protein
MFDYSSGKVVIVTEVKTFDISRLKLDIVAVIKARIAVTVFEAFKKSGNFNFLTEFIEKPYFVRGLVIKNK